MFRPLTALFATLAWLTVGTQFALSIRSSLGAGGTVLDGVISYFGYFTLLTNIFCAAVMLAYVRGAQAAGIPGAPLDRVGAHRMPETQTVSDLWEVLRRPSVMSTAATAIVIVATVYHGVLAALYNPQGIDRAVDTMLHTVLPVLYLAFWWYAIPRGGISLREVPSWLVYPGVYAGYVFARGALIAQYPYPFIDVSAIGYPRALLNAVVIAAVFSAVGAILVGVNRLAGPKRP